MPKLNDQIVDAAKTMVGWPYRHAGRNEFGIDCVGVIIVAAHKCGITTYDTTNYPKRPNAKDLRREMKHHLTRIPNEEIQNGDVAVFSLGGHPCHMGIVECDSDGAWLIHAYAPVRKVIRELMATVETKGVHVMSFRYTGG